MNNRKERGRPNCNSTSPKTDDSGKHYQNRTAKSTRQWEPRKKTTQHDYCAIAPQGLYGLTPKNYLVVAERGKAAEALVGAGVPAVGIPGLYPYVGGGNARQLLPGLADVLLRLNPVKVYFLADAFGFAYQHAALATSALFLASELGRSGVEVGLLQLDIGGPRTIDRLIRATGDGFGATWSDLIAGARVVDAREGRYKLAAELIEAQLPNVAKLPKETRSELFEIARRSHRQAKKGPFKKALCRVFSSLANKAPVQPTIAAAPPPEGGLIALQRSVLAMTEGLTELLQHIGASLNDPVLAAIRRQFEVRDINAIPTIELMGILPLSNGKQLAAYLRPFGIKPRAFSRGGRRFRGYRREDFVLDRQERQLSSAKAA